MSLNFNQYNLINNTPANKHKEEDYYPDLKWEDEPIKVLPMAVTEDNELKNYWMAAATLNTVRVFVDQVSAENFAKNNFKDQELKVWHFTHE